MTDELMKERKRLRAERNARRAEVIRKREADKPVERYEPLEELEVGDHEKSYDDYQGKKRDFITHLMGYEAKGDHLEAYRLAGYSCTGAWRNNARRLYKQVRPAVMEIMNARIGQGVIVALDVVYELMTDKEVNPAVRLKAAQDYLTRGGLDKPIEVEVKVEKRKSDVEIQEEIDAILELKVVSNQ